MNLEKAISKLSGVVSAATVAVMATILVYAVAMRYVFDTAALQATEIARVGLAVFMFMGIAYDEAERVHVRVDVLLRVLPVRFRSLLVDFVSPVLVALYCAVIVVHGAEMTWEAAAARQMSYTAWQYPEAVGIVWVPIGFLMVGLLVGYRLWQRLWSKGNGADHEVGRLGVDEQAQRE